MRPAGDQDHVFAAARQVRADQASDGAGAEDRDSHFVLLKVSATERR
jgi:hypothetical protein